MNNTTIDDIAACVGFTAATKMQAWLGGKTIRLPDRFTADWWLVHMTSRTAAEAFHKRFAFDLGLDRIMIPCGAEARRYVRNAQIARMIADGASLPEVGRRFNLTLRQVQNIRRELVAEGWLWYDTETRGHRLPRMPRDGTVPKIFGTGEVFDEPPPLSAAR